MRTVIVECKLPYVPSWLNESISMAKTIGHTIIKILIQQRKSVHHSYCIGPGKLNELKHIVEDNNIEKIIFTNTLPSSQIFKLKKEIGHDINIIDRNLLILEVFNNRAMTKEAKLQIQLAQLRYTFSWGREYLKMKGILGEQVGWSGPGDYPFKEYEKIARKRIKKIINKLQEIRFKKDLLRSRRQDLGFPIVALAGYTQSGKTTFFNKITSEEKDVGLGPFTTLSTFARKVDAQIYHLTKNFILIDSIGFIEGMHNIIIDAFDSTLKELTYANIILLFLDAGDNLDTFSRRAHSSNTILRRIGVKGKIIVCVNKIDLVNTKKIKSLKNIVQRQFLDSKIHFISTEKTHNLGTLLTDIDNSLHSIQLNYLHTGKN